jgi:glycine cleavage system aminomethyltransferase T
MSQTKLGPMLPHTAIPLDRKVPTFTRFGSFFEPWEFTDWLDESMSWKQNCYIGDWSPLQKMRVQGPDALAFFSSIAVNGFAKFDLGQAKHIILCNGCGKIMGEGILMRFAEDDFEFISGPGVPWALYQFRRGEFRSKLTHPREFLFQVQGPDAVFTAEAAAGESLRDIGFMRFREIRIADVPCRALRQGMAGELGYEIQGPLEHGPEVFEAIMRAGQQFGIRRLGGRTKMVNHVEACFPTPSVDYVPAMYGPDERDFALTFSENAREVYRVTDESYEYADIGELYRSPAELGWKKNIRFDHDFIGRAALEAEAATAHRTIVTLVWNAEDVIDVYASLFRKEPNFLYMEMPRNILSCLFADRVTDDDGATVGVSTSRCYSYFFREMLSLCVIDAQHASPGTDVHVVWGRPGHPQKSIRAKVAAAPYKKDNRRSDVSALRSST